jgi:hypothetical protein
MVADHQSGRDQSGITEQVRRPSFRGSTRKTKQAANRHALFVNIAGQRLLEPKLDYWGQPQLYQT